MKRTLYFLLALTAPLCASNVYISGFGGVDWPRYTLSASRAGLDSETSVDADFKIGYVVGGALGYHWKTWLRSEIEGAYRQNKYCGLCSYSEREDDYELPALGSCEHEGPISGTHHLCTAIFNTYLEPWAFKGLRPFLGIGLGYGHSVMEICLLDLYKMKKRDSMVAAQLMLGTSVAITRAVSATLQYRALALESTKSNGSSIAHESVEAGLRFRF